MKTLFYSVSLLLFCSLFSLAQKTSDKTLDANIKCNMRVSGELTACPGQTIYAYTEFYIEDEEGDYHFKWSANPPGIIPKDTTITNKNTFGPFVFFEFRLTPAVTTTYTVVASNSYCGTRTSSFAVKINNDLHYPLLFQKQICPGAITTIGGTPSTACGGSGTFSYRWKAEPPDPSLSNDTISNPLVAPLSQTTYTVTITDRATNITATSMQLVSILSPTFTVSADSNTKVCKGGYIDLHIKNPVVYEYYDYKVSWSQNPVMYEKTATGIRLFPEKSTDLIIEGGCKSTASYSLTISDSVDIGLSVSDTGYVCSGTPVQLSVKANDTQTYMYSLNSIGHFGDEYAFYRDTSSSVDTSIINVPSMAETRYILRAESDGKCKVLKYTKTRVDLFNIYGPFTSEYCYDSIASIKPMFYYSGKSPYSYSWIISTGSLTSQTTDSIAKFKVSERTDYVVTITDAIGCTASSKNYVNSRKPDIVLNSSLVPHCQPYYHLNFSQSTPGSYDTYSWFENGKNIGSGQYINVTPQGSSATYKLLYTYKLYTKTCGSFVYFKTLNAVPSLELSFTEKSPSCLNCNDGRITATVKNGQAPFNFKWTPGNHPNSAILDSAEAGKVYTLYFRDAGYCSIVNTFTLNYDPHTELRDLKEDKHFSLTTNQVSSSLTLIKSSLKKLNAATYKIHNTLGLEVVKGLVTNELSQSIDLSSVSKGLYYISIYTSSGESIETFKFMKY